MSEIQVAVIDDYQSVASRCADWEGLDCQVTFISDPIRERPSMVQSLQGFDVIVAMRERTRFDASFLDVLPRLQLLITTGMRNASIDLDAAKRNNVIVCGTRSPGHATAELAFGLIHVLARGLNTEIASVESGGWQVGLGRDLRGSRLGVIGLGRLGSQVAHFGQTFGMDVVAWSENLTDERADEIGVESVSKAELLETSDFVTIHLRLSDRTRALIAADDLRMMKRTAYLINTSRGEIVVEEALLEAVRTKAIAGAALDVFGEEPLAADHPFRQQPGILATPHIGYVTQETYEIFYGDAVEDIRAWLGDSPIRVLE